TLYLSTSRELGNAPAGRLAVRDGGKIQQIGSPVDMYDHPANRFVAAFLGTANLIEGKIESDRFLADGIVLYAVKAPPGSACVSIRPQHIAVQASGIGLPGVVEEREFLGETTRYRIKAGSHRLIVDEPHRRDIAPRQG